MSRTRSTVAATALALVVLTACSSGRSGKAEAGAEAGRPVSGGSLTWAVETEPITFNPHQYAQAKARLLNELGQDLETLYQRIHGAAGAGDLAALEAHKGALGTLKDMRDFIQQLPTWPWQPGTLKNLVAPLLVPAIVFLIRQILSRLIGP